MSAELAFLLLLSGALTIYCEFVWPGRIFPGMAGALMLAAAVYALARMPLPGSGIALIGIAAALFLVEAFWRVDFVAGGAATISLSIGSTLLVRNPGGIPACVMFGAVTMFLCWEAKRARRNKRSDLMAGEAAE